MFSTFFNFELRFWLRGMMVYIFLMIMGLLIFGAAASDDVVVGGTLENTYRNAPYVIQTFYSIMSLLTCIMIAAFVNSAASRDFTYNTHQLIFTKPMHKFPYLMGRFWGSTLIAMIPMLGVSLGIIIAKWMPWTDADRWGPISWGAHVWGFLVFAMPNTVVIAAIIFAIAVFTRSTIASFLGAVVVIVGYSIAGSMIENLDNERLAMLLDPLAINTFSLQTKYWTTDDKNHLYVIWSGIMLLNRLLWLAVGGGILALAYWRFSFAERHKAGRADLDAITDEQATAKLPAVSLRSGFGARCRQLLSQIHVDFWGIVRGNVFIVVMIVAALNMVAGLVLSASEGFGISARPVTYNMVAIIRANMYLFLVCTMVYYAGALVWKERDASLDEVYDALPYPTWIAFVGRLISLTLVITVVLALGILVGMIVQACFGYTRFQLALYVRELLMLDLIRMFCLAVLAMFAHVLSPNKYVGYFAFVVLLIANVFAWNLLHVESRMVRYANIGSYTYSDLFRFAPFQDLLQAFSVYWLLFAGLICTAATLCWQRGRESSYPMRLRYAVARFRGPAAAFGTGILLLWVTCAGWVYYNTKVLNEFRTSYKLTSLRAGYEKEFKQEYESLPRPRVTQVKYHIDIYPQERAIKLQGHQTMVNKTNQPIDKMFILLADGYETQLQIDNASLVKEFPQHNVQMYALQPPLEPGASAHMSYTVSYEAQGFENTVTKTQIVQNGTFFNNSIVPQIGYQTDGELTNKNDRKKHDLGEPTVMPMLDPGDLEARANTYLSNWSDWVDVETVISTSTDQIAVAPGSLLKSWEEGDRRYFHYKVDHPSLNFYSFISARYQVETRKWKDVDIEVYYHPEHVWNVDNMLRSIRRSLEYCSEHFGPYRHKQARIIEFPRVASFAQAFPGTMPYSEGIGFIADISDPEDIDKVFYVVAHEMAHQWWAHQVIGANMQGATLLSETLAQYSALMVMESEYGRDMMRKFLKYEMDQYLRSRGRELLDERPLVRVEAQQGYIHYNKGSVVMYYLKELIGEEKVNAALRSLVDRFAYADPPYPTSMDLLDALRKETPEEFQGVLDDLFEQITLFSNRTIESTYKELADGRFRVKLEIECEKYQADEQGAQSEVPIDDWIEIGAFAEPEDKKKYGATLYRERIRVNQKNTKVAFEVDAKPALVGVDPFCLLIDRMPDDNMKRPKRTDAS